MCQLRVYLRSHMIYGMAKSRFCITYVHEVQLAMCITQPTHSRMVFIRYPAYSKRYVMYGKHVNGGMEIDSHNVNFLRIRS